jgi:hypothetical protein
MYENWTIADWKHVFFNDKTKIARYNLDGRSWYWIGDEERGGPQHVHHTMKHGNESAMIWKYMMAFGSGAMYKIVGGMNKQLYKFILENFLWSTLQNYNLDPYRLVFQ